MGNNFTCSNCLHAYTNDHVLHVYCCCKDFRHQFDPDLDCTVKPNETCDMWCRRRLDQPKLIFSKVIQLSLFN